MATNSHNTLEDHSRSAARLAAVQALYQMETAETGVERIIHDFQDYWMSPRAETADEDGVIPPDLVRADGAYFAKLVRGVIDAQARIDPYLERQLAKGWRLARLDATARAILRAGLFELIRLPDMPAKVIMDEYINIAHAFFDGEEPGFINGVLNAAAHHARKDELSL